MRLLDRYIAKTVLGSIALVTLMLAGLQIFILFVDQLDSLGKGDYGILQAASFVFLQMPYQVYLFFPMASLLGSLIGLGVIANHHELVVMRAAGMSIGQITRAVLKAALILIFFVTILGETVIPQFVQFSHNQRALALSGGQTLRTARGVWIRHQNDFLNIGAILPHHVLEQVYQFHFNDAHRLQFSRKIAKIDIINGYWQAHDVEETQFYKNETRVRHDSLMTWDVALKPAILSVSTREPDEMTLLELYRYLHAQKISHQTVLNYQLAFWQRLAQPLTTVVMMMLAIPFIFGPLRTSSMGSKLLVGATAGFSFYIMNRFLGSVSQVYQFPSELAAIAPTCLFALIGLYLMRRVR